MKTALRFRRCRAVAAAVLLPTLPLLLLPAAAPAQVRRGSNNNRRPAPPFPPPGAGNAGENALPLMAPGAPGSAEAGVRLPFNLLWGDSPERLVRTLAGGGTKVTERRVSANGVREVWTVEGLLRAGPKLQSVLLTFMDHALAGLELRYGEPDWDVARFNETMGFLRRQLERELGGPGELVSRETTSVPAPPTPPPAPSAAPSPVGGSPAVAADVPAPGGTPAPAPSPTPAVSEEPPIRQTLTGYAWKRADTVIELFYFAAEQPQKALAFRSLSVHFRYNDPLAGNPEAGPSASPAPPGAPTPAFPADPNSDPLPQH